MIPLFQWVVMQTGKTYRMIFTHSWAQPLRKLIPSAFGGPVEPLVYLERWRIRWSGNFDVSLCVAVMGSPWIT